MYTQVERRTMNRARVQETMQRAQAEFFPRLQQAPGFVGFYLVADEPNGIQTAIVVWEDKAHAEAFGPQAAPWLSALDELGHTIQSSNQGETVLQITPKP
jgi:heme-degrading monooxygenase HmoA